jgi:hypothetical protein
MMRLLEQPSRYFPRPRLVPFPSPSGWEFEWTDAFATAVPRLERRAQPSDARATLDAVLAHDWTDMLGVQP